MEDTNVGITLVKLPDEFSPLVSGKIALKIKTIKKPKRAKGETTTKTSPKRKAR